MLWHIIKEVVIVFQYILGTVLNDINRILEAIIEYSKAIEINSQYALAYYSRGTCLCFI